MLEKHASKEFLRFLETFHYKEKCRMNIKAENSSENLTSLWQLHNRREAYFGILVSALHFYSGDRKHYVLLSKHLFHKKQ